RPLHPAPEPALLVFFTQLTAFDLDPFVLRSHFPASVEDSHRQRPRLPASVEDEHLQLRSGHGRDQEKPLELGGGRGRGDD
ncbi:hypothetical protein CYD76_30480, partial [Klebsiella pneumoniae]